MSAEPKAVAQYRPDLAFDGGVRRIVEIQLGIVRRVVVVTGVADRRGPAKGAATLYTKMGIDPTQLLHTNTGRPVQLVNKGEPIKDLGADGMPASWKKKFNLDANDTTLAQRDLQGDGYTVMDKYLAGLDPTKKIDWNNPQSNLNTLAVK